jgi:hypothetical protein
MSSTAHKLDPEGRVFLSPRMFAHRTSFSESQVRRFMAAGQLHSIRVGKRFLIPATETTEFPERLAAELLEADNG